ncbi:MAG TPA: hypothetical protein VLJ19_14605 [Variovorax sp.]|nr:hypothetical protein [Variovorax sp.]
MQSATRHQIQRAACFGAAVAALGGVFLLYTRPAFLVTLIDQVWACF